MKDVYKAFKKIDLTKSGRLTLEQLEEGLRILGIDQDAKALMTILDMDQNGFVSYTEFLAGVLSTDVGLSDRLVREAFDMFDLDGDGFVSRQELKVMLSGSGPLVEVLPDGHTIDEVMQDIGGEQGFITYTNFRDYLQEA